MMKCTRMFHAINNVIHVRPLWLGKVVLNVLLQKECTKSNGLPQIFPNM